MSYTPQQWHDDTTDSPYGPISGDRLNYIEAGIQAAAAAADAAGTASGGGSVTLGTAAPIIDGVAAAGSSGSAAHEDHVHPTDTSRAALASPTFTGHPVGVTEAALNNSTRLATTAYTDTAVGVETTRATTAEGLLAPLASPTFSGTPSLPTASVGVTQSAADSSTKLATTAFVTTADNLKANLASPTFSGTPSLPTATVGVTQSAADGSTKLATTAYVDTADGLKANLASPTFIGTPSLPTASVGVTQSAADSSLKLATTAFVTTADNLKANLAGPTFTGTVTLPSTTIATTPSASDNSTKPATTAYVDTADALKANIASPTFSGTPTLPSATVANTFDRFAGPWLPFVAEQGGLAFASVAATVNSSGSGRFVVFRAPCNGVVDKFQVYCTAATTATVDAAIMDTGQTLSGTYTRIWSYANDHGGTALSITSGNASTYVDFGNPNLSVVANRLYLVGVSCSEATTTKFLKTNTIDSTMLTMPSGYFSSTPGITVKLGGFSPGSNNPIGTAITDGNISVSAGFLPMLHISPT